ncbi:MAG: hypothetical protein BWY83_02412 [bacterium ADurb.Bin478]|nr:MAG: hypothetical protein BWY83_02412 [bacterium ADurb.Bin478]
MPVDAQNDLAPAVRQSQVQSVWNDAMRIVQQACMRQTAHFFRNDFPRPIVRHTVHDQHFIALGRIILFADGIQRLADIGLFVTNRHDDRDKRVHTSSAYQ